MFDTGFWEFTLIAIIALIVVGPERIPALAKAAGKYVGKLRNFIAGVKADVNDEFDFDSAKNYLNLQDKNSILDIVDDVKKDITDSAKDIQDSAKTISDDEVKSVKKNQ